MKNKNKDKKELPRCIICEKKFISGNGHLAGIIMLCGSCRSKLSDKTFTNVLVWMTKARHEVYV